ncbi:MAG: hypothetical protein KY446_12750 [Proteobacteria bacterium]|nr:hypothetical protein [Pseudomonadota bacterium]
MQSKPRVPEDRLSAADPRRRAAELRAQAARCRRLADGVDHAITARTLTELAAEYEEQAARLGAAGETSPTTNAPPAKASHAA